LPVYGCLSSIELTMYTTGEKYLDTDSPYTSATISIADVTGSTTLRTNISSGMTDFRGEC
jgi:hypothetical protein